MFVFFVQILQKKFFSFVCRHAECKDFAQHEEDHATCKRLKRLTDYIEMKCVDVDTDENVIYFLKNSLSQQLIFYSI